MESQIKTLFFCVDGNAFGPHDYQKSVSATVIAFCDWLNEEVEKTLHKPVKFDIVFLGYSDVSFRTEASNLDEKEIMAVAYLIASKVILETTEEWLLDTHCYVSVEGHDEEHEPVDVVFKI